jgi:hypothetical protein
MGMHPKLGALTAKDQRRLYFIKEIGCVACLKRFGEASPGGDGHHAEDEAGRAISHATMICLCDWHHTGKPPSGYTKRAALDHYGPSRHGHAVAFAETFGTDLQLLEFQNARLASYCSSFVIAPL